MDGSDFWDVVELLDWGRGAMTSSQLSPSWHIWPLFLPGSYSPSTTRWRPICALDRRDVADRVFGPFRDRFFPDEFLGWRCACIAGGRGCYADALAGRSAPAAGACFEELMFAPMRAWTRSHGTKPEAYPHQPVPSCQTFGNTAGWT